MNVERQLYYDRVIVEFNPTVYNNDELFVKYIQTYLIPAVANRSSLFVCDFAEFHKTYVVRALLHQHDIIPSLIPPGCTSLLQPLDVSVSGSFKPSIQDFTDHAIEMRGRETDKWTVGERRVLTTKCVRQMWETFCLSKRQLVIDSFRNVGLSLPIDGSHDYELRIKGFASEDLEIENWYEGGQATIDEGFGQGHTVQKNTVLHTQDDDSQVIEYLNKG